MDQTGTSLLMVFSLMPVSVLALGAHAPAQHVVGGLGVVRDHRVGHALGAHVGRGGQNHQAQ
jgi:hypothetical protein